MVTYASSNAVVEFEEYLDAERYEKISRHHERIMPSRRSLSAKRARQRTPASRRASRRIAAKIGGKDRRRQRHPN